MTTNPGDQAGLPTTAPPVSGRGQIVASEGSDPQPGNLSPAISRTVRRLQTRLDKVDAYLDDTKLGELLGKCDLKGIGYYESVLLNYLDKFTPKSALPRLPDDTRKLDELMPALLLEMKRRGLTAKLTETTRTAEVTTE